MHTGTEGIPIRFTVDHSGGKIGDVIGLPTRALRAARKYSLNNTLLIAVVSTWFQFSLGYVAAIIITSNDLSFITAILNPTLMSAYALVSVILGAVLLTSLALKYMNREEIEESSIDKKLRGNKPNEISKINKEAEKVEIIINLGSKGTKFSIIIPISKTQGEILDGQIEENRNKVILLTIPYVISAAVIIGALVQNRFSFTNVLGWEEWSFIALVSIITIVGICIAFNKLRDNEKNETHDFVKKFDNWDILFPCRKDSIVSVLKGRATDQKGNDLQSQLIEFAREFKDEFINLFANRLDIACNSFDAFLDKTEILISKLLDSADANIKETLDDMGENVQETLDHLKGIREDIITEVKELHGEISIVLNDANKFIETVNSVDIKGTFSELQSAIKIAKNKIEQLQLSSWIGSFKQNTQPDEFLNQMKKTKEKVEELTTVNKELKKSLKEAKTQVNKRSISCGTSCGSENIPNEDLNAQLNEEKKAREENKLLKSEKRTEELKKENAKLKKGLAQQKEKEKWEEKINGPASEFLRYILESIKLYIKFETEGELKELLTTLQDYHSKAIIYWKDGSQAICELDKLPGPTPPQPNTTFFVDKNTQAGFAAAWERARG